VKEATLTYADEIAEVVSRGIEVGWSPDAIRKMVDAALVLATTDRENMPVEFYEAPH
jgi:hypothetical protein